MKKKVTIISLLLLAALLIPGVAGAFVNSHPIVSPFEAEAALEGEVVGSSMNSSLNLFAPNAVGDVVHMDNALVAGADYLQHAQADVTEDNAGNGNPDVPDDPDDGGWDWNSTAFTHSTAASPTNIYGATAQGLYYAYLETGDTGYMTAMQDAATVMAANPSIRSAADLIFLMKFQDLPGVPADIYKAAAQAKYDARIVTYGSATLFAEYIRDIRGVNQNYPNGIIAWDIGGWVVAAQMLADRYGTTPYDYAADADAMAEVLWQDSFNDNPGLFDIVDDAGWDPTYTDRNFWWYSLGITGLIDAFEAADLHTAEIPGLITILLDCQYAGGGFSGSYGANPDDEDWQSTAYAVLSLAVVDQATYQNDINRAAYWLGATQDEVSGGWVYDSGNHYPEIGGEATAALSFGENPDEVWVDDDYCETCGNDTHLWGYDAFDTISNGIDGVNDGGTVNVAAGTYIEDLDVNKEVSIIGAGANQVTIDLTNSPGHNGAGIYVTANNVTLQGFTLAGPQPSTSIPRYGIKFGTVSGGSLSDLVVRDIYRSGYDLLGTSDTTLSNIESRDNGGHGLALTDCHDITLTGYTALGNSWQAISIATWGRYTTLGTSEIVLNGPFTLDNVVQLEEGDYVNGGPLSGDAIITYSSNPADGADVTFDANDFAFALHGRQDDSPNQNRIWFFPDLATARYAASLAPLGHLTGDEMYIEDLADPTQLYVCPECDLLAALDAAADGFTIHIDPGTFAVGPQVVIDIDVDIDGAGEGVTILNPTVDTGSSGDARGWFLVNEGAALNLSNLTLDGTGRLVYQGIRYRGSGTIENITFTEIKFNESGPTYSGVAVAAFGDNNVDITDSTFSEIGRIGVLYFGTGITGSTFHGNTYTGKGSGDWLDYALDISNGAVVNVTNNIVSNNYGVASVDNSTSAGYLVSTYFGTGTTANFSYNDIVNNSTGIFVGYDASDTSSVTAHNNCFTGNDEGVYSTAPLVDATNNSWGDASGPYHPVNNPTGTGDEVSDYVTFDPWLNTCSGWQNVDQGTQFATLQAALYSAATGETIQPVGNQPGGGVVNIPGVTIDLNGMTGGAGSPFLTVAAADVIVQNGTLDGLGSADPAILIQAGGDNFTMQDVEVTGWEDGIQVAASVTSLKVVSNWIHSNTDAGLQIDSGVTIGGITTIEGNLFKVNGGNGIQNNSGNSLMADYNSWGDINGAANGDGISADVVAVPYTYAEFFMDMAPDALATSVNVASGQTFDVALKADAVNLYGLSFRLTYDPAVLTYDSIVFSSPWDSGCSVIGSLPAGEINYFCSPTPATAWTATAASGSADGTIATLRFIESDPSSSNAAWPSYIDIDHVNSTAGSVGGIKVFVNNAGYNDPSTAPNRGDITDTDDGRINLSANFTGFIDLQGRANDSGATISVYDQAVKASALYLAFGTSSAGGGYTTAYNPSHELVLSTAYSLTVDAPLYLPTTAVADTDYAHNHLLDAQPLTTLSTIILLGGDATNDDYIDVLDAACIGGDYHNPTPTCSGGGAGEESDVNADGIVDILDLTLMGGNWHLGSSPWTP